jgi:hypothetical protein
MDKLPIFATGIHFDATTEELEKALPFTKGKWKSYSTPIFTQEQLKEGRIDIDASLHKFEFATPYNNYLNGV